MTYELDTNEVKLILSVFNQLQVKPIEKDAVLIVQTIQSILSKLTTEAT